MKNINLLINEAKENYIISEAAKKRPSALLKYKTGTREEKIRLLVGDVYDLSGDSTVDSSFKYYNGEGNGYITDKNGYVYDVKCSEDTGDAGRIAGGTRYHYCTIYNINDGKSYTFSGYSAVFSNPSSKSWGTILSDISDGSYLEDYIAKHWNDLDYRKREELEDLRKLGDEKALTYVGEKTKRRKDKKEAFNQRYYDLGSMENYEEKLWTVNRSFTYINIGIIIKSGELTIDYGFKKNESYDMLKDKITELLLKAFKIKSLDILNGMLCNIILGFNRPKGLKYYSYRLGLDLKKKKFVCIGYTNTNRQEIVKDIQFVLGIGKELLLYSHKYDVLTPEMKALLTASSKYYLKETGLSNKGKWINDRSRYMSKDIKQEVIKDYDKYLETYYFNSKKEETPGKSFGAIKGNLIHFETKYIQDAMNGAVDMAAFVNIDTETNMPDTVISQTTSDDVVDEPAPKSVKDMDPTQHMIDRVNAWKENIKKRINLKACSPEKLKAYYKLCDKLEFDFGKGECKKELDRRNIKLESRLQIRPLINFL